MATNPPTHVPAALLAQVEVLSTKMDTITLMNRDQSVVLGKLTEAVGKLALIEERQANAQEAQTRAFTAIEKIETRVKVLEDQSPINKLTSGVAGKLVMMVLSAVVGATLIGVIRPTQQPAVMIQQSPQATQPVQRAP